MLRRLALPLVVALHLLLRLAIWMRPIRQLDDLVIPDDAYLSLHLARSIAHGLGPHYGLAATNGFQPLYVFLMAPVFALAPGDPLAPLRIALLLLIVADAVALALTLRLARKLGCSRSATAVAGLVWALGAYSVRTSLNGLETSIAAAAIAAVALQWHRLRSAPAGPGAFAGFGALLGVAYLARIDSLILLPPLAVSLLATPAAAGHGRSRAATLRGLGIASAVALAVALPWLAYSWRWTHSLYPISGRAVRYVVLSHVQHRPTWSNTYARMLGRAARALARGLYLPAGLGVALALATRAVRGAPASRLAARARGILPLAAFGALLVLAYALVVFGPWYFARYFYPLLIPAVLAVAIAGDELVRALGPRRHAAVAIAVLVVVAGSVADPMLRALVTPGSPPSWGYLRIGEWARDHVPAGTVIGGSQTGALGYFADRLTVINLDGVVNRDCYDAMRAGRMLDYIRGTGVRTLFDQDDIGLIARETRNDDPHALTRLGVVQGIRSWGDTWKLYRVKP